MLHIGGIMKTNWEKRVIQNKLRRQRQLQVYRLCSMIVIILIATMTVTLTSKASSDKEQVYYKYYSNIVVQPGETLDNIALDHMDAKHYTDAEDYVSEVRLMNHLSEDDSIHPGDYLIVPYYSSDYKK